MSWYVTAGPANINNFGQVAKTALESAPSGPKSDAELEQFDYLVDTVADLMLNVLGDNVTNVGFNLGGHVSESDPRSDSVTISVYRWTQPLPDPNTPGCGGEPTQK